VLSDLQETSEPMDGDHVTVSIEPRRLWPTQRFTITPFGRTHHDRKTDAGDPRWRATASTGGHGWQADLTIPFVCLKDCGFDGRPMRINVERRIPGIRTLAWVDLHPLPPRLLFGTDNPMDYGWLLFDD